MSIGKALDVYVRSRFTLIVVVTTEEERVVEIVRSMYEGSGRACLSWDLAEGFRAVSPRDLSVPQAPDPITALEKVEQEDGELLVLLRDFHDCWGNPKVRRKLRNVVQRLKYTKKSLLVITPCRQVPEELKDDVVVIDLPAPGTSEIEDVLDRMGATPGVHTNLTALGREKLVQAALGLSVAQTQRVLAKAIVAGGTIDDRHIEMVTEEKKQIIRESEALQFFPVTETPGDVGGLGVLKEWLRLRERGFTNEAREYGLPLPKGVLLIGISGTGKSLSAKTIGGAWRLPVVRLDSGALFGSLVGESEERVRRALRLVETVAPCVLWVDEIEKAFAAGGNDSGTSMRVLGTLLTWMQEKESPCFVVATANAVGSLPPELLRKGRFDEIFFLDLPTFAERREIIAVHLRKRCRVVQDFSVDLIARASEGYVGAEIEQAILDAMYRGFSEHREVTTEDVLQAMKNQVPLSRSHRETVEELRGWIREGRAQSASFHEPAEAEAEFVGIPLDVPQTEPTN